MSPVGLKAHLAANPLGTFFSNGFKRQFVSKLDFKLRAIQVTLSIEAWYVELSFLFVGTFGDKRG